MYVQPQFRFCAFVKAQPPTWLLLHVSECFLRQFVNRSLLSWAFSLWKQFFYASRGFCPNGGTQRCQCFQMRHKLLRAVRLMAFVTTAIEERAGFVLLKARATNDAGVWLGEETSDGGAWRKTWPHCCCERRLWCSNSQWTLAWPSSRDRRYECTSIAASETLRVSCQENFNPGALYQKFGKITIMHLTELEGKKKNCHLHHRCFLCSVDGLVKISTSGVGAGTQAVTALGAFAYKPRKNCNFGAIICLASVTFWSRGIALWVRLTMKDPSLPSESKITLPKMLATGVAVCKNDPWQWMG